MDKIKSLGQVFTQEDEVKFVLSLRKNKGRVLEPSAGKGSFSSVIECVSIELDKTIALSNSIIMDFFDYSIKEKFETIIGNPPYVKGRNIDKETRRKFGKSLITEKGNLYLHFIEKSFYHLTDNGEIIFITPKDFLASKATEKLIRLMLSNGSFTHYYDYTGQNIFKNATPDNVCIWRYQKGIFTNEIKTNDGIKNVIENDGRIIITSQNLIIPFAELFYVKVGAVPGKGNTYFKGNTPFVYSKTRQTNNVRMMNYQPHEWIRGITNNDSSKERIYVNCKTRIHNPFFTHPCKNWDGSVLAIFPKITNNINEIINVLNSINWNELGFVWNGKYVFTQSSLTKLLLPDECHKLLKNKNFLYE
jgi:adenine-specific DNA-methyltransferase